MFAYKTLLVLVAVLALSWLIQGTAASARRSFGRDVEDKARQEVISLASRIIKLSMYGYDWDEVSKRNGGTADTLYNMPDLESIGRR